MDTHYIKQGREITVIAKIEQYMKTKRENRTALKDYRAVTSIRDERVQHEVFGISRHLR